MREGDALARRGVFTGRVETAHREKCRECKGPSTCGFYRGFLEGRGKATDGHWRDGDGELVRFCDLHGQMALRRIAVVKRPAFLPPL